MPSAATQVRVPCEICGTEFVQKHSRQRYCSKRCLWKSKNANHREAQRRSLAKRYAANPERFRAYSRAMHLKHRPKRLAKIRETYLHAQATTPWIFPVQSAKARAKKYGLPFDLTVEWAHARWTGRCELTGIAFVPNVGPGPRMYSATIDKIDPKLGYTRSNCRIILHAVNALKNTGTDEEMYEIATALLRRRPTTRQ